MSPLVLVAALLFAADAPRDSPEVLRGLSTPELQMLAPSRERILDAEALVDSVHLTGKECIADVGAGPGFFSLKLARRVPQGHVIATDIDAPALEALRKRAQLAGLDNIETRQVGPDVTGLEPASVDLVFLCQVDHYLKDRTTYFKRLATALKPGGRLVIANYDREREDAERAALESGFVRSGAPFNTKGHFAVVFVRGGTK